MPSTQNQPGQDPIATRKRSANSIGGSGLRSTPGSTSAYVAVSATTVGVGNIPGHDHDSETPPRASRIAGPEPPPENTIDDTLARGLNEPSAFATSVASTGTQRDPRDTRTGSDDTSNVIVPSGFASTRLVSVVSPATSTWVPDATAADTATASGDWEGDADPRGATERPPVQAAPHADTGTPAETTSAARPATRTRPPRTEPTPPRRRIRCTPY